MFKFHFSFSVAESAVNRREVQLVVVGYTVAGTHQTSNSGLQNMAACPDIFEDLGEEEVISAKTSSKEDAAFDETIGHIQDILLDDSFTDLQHGFMEKHYHHFEDTEENKFIYTDIFREYTELVEAHLETELKARIPGFQMQTFVKSLDRSREGEVGEEIFDLLLSFTDFLSFKQMFLDYKAEKEGRSLDLGGLVVNSLHCER